MSAELVTINNKVPLLYDKACRAIAEATKIDEVKEWKDRAAAYQEYARQAKSKEMEKQAKEIRLRATRRMGQLLLMLNKSEGGRPPSSNKLPPPMAGVSEYQSTLEENKIPQRTAENWQALAKKNFEFEPYRSRIMRRESNNKGNLLNTAKEIEDFGEDLARELELWKEEMDELVGEKRA